MKSLIQILLLVIMVTPNDFLNKVLTDYDSHSYLISTKIIDNSEKQIVIENSDLYFWLSETKIVSSKKDYESYMRDVLKNSKAIEFPKIKKKMRDDFHFVSESTTVNSIKARGKEEFIKYFFSNSVINDSLIEPDEIYHVVSVLFDWEVPCRFDCETGALIISED